MDCTVHGVANSWTDRVTFTFSTSIVSSVESSTRSLFHRSRNFSSEDLNNLLMTTEPTPKQLRQDLKSSQSRRETQSLSVPLCTSDFKKSPFIEGQQISPLLTGF